MSPFDCRLPIIAAEAKVKTCHVHHCFHAIREMGKSFHIAAFASFAGIEPRHVEAIISALKAHNAMPAPAKRETITGTRLPVDFTMPDEWLNWSINERGWTMPDARQEAASFVDYWAGVSGAKGVKADWQATWRNHVRRSHRAGYAVPALTGLSALQIAERELHSAELLGRDYEAGIARRKIAALSNVVPFKATG